MTQDEFNALKSCASVDSGTFTIGECRMLIEEIERKNRVIAALQQTILIDAPIVERLQRENSELLKTISILGPSTAALLKRAEDTEAKLAAAEADTKRLDKLEALTANGKGPVTLDYTKGPYSTLRAAIDAAKLVEPDYCETDETAEFLRREDAAKTEVIAKP